MPELSHDGCLLKEPDLIFLVSSCLEDFDGNLLWTIRCLPQSSVHIAKLTGSNTLLYATVEGNACREGGEGRRKEGYGMNNKEGWWDGGGRGNGSGGGSIGMQW